VYVLLVNLPRTKTTSSSCRAATGCRARLCAVGNSFVWSCLRGLSRRSRPGQRAGRQFLPSRHDTQQPVIAAPQSPCREKAKTTGWLHAAGCRRWPDSGFQAPPLVVEATARGRRTRRRHPATGQGSCHAHWFYSLVSL